MFRNSGVLNYWSEANREDLFLIAGITIYHVPKISIWYIDCQFLYLISDDTVTCLKGLASGNLFKGTCFKRLALRDLLQGTSCFKGLFALNDFLLQGTWMTWIILCGSLLFYISLNNKSNLKKKKNSKKQIEHRKANTNIALFCFQL